MILSGTAGCRNIVYALALIVLVTAALRVPLLAIPFERDEGEYAYIAWRLGAGELPYRDWVDQKPPAVFWVYRAALALPGDSVRAVHIAVLLFSAATSCALFFLAGRMMRQGWALAAACFFAILSADPLVQGTAANTEQFMLLPLVLALLLFLRLPEEERPRARARDVVLMGVFTGAAVSLKQVAAVNGVLLIAVYPFLPSPRSGRTGPLAFAAWFGAGFLAFWGLIAAYFLARGGFADMIYNVFTHNLAYVQAVSAAERWANFRVTISRLAQSEAVVWLAAVGGLIALLRTGPRWLFLLVGGWLAASMAGVSASGYYFPHYFQQVLPPLAVLAALGAGMATRAFPGKGLPSAVRGSVAVVILALLPAKTFMPFLFRYSPAESVRAIYPGNYFAEMPALAARVAAVTGPDDRVFIFGAEPEVLFYARRVSATRYIFLFPLYGPYRDAREKQEAAAREVAGARPKAALYLPNLLFSMPGSVQEFTRWSREYLQNDFRSDTYLIVDHLGLPRVVPRTGGGRSLLPDDRIVGAVLVRSGSPGREAAP